MAKFAFPVRTNGHFLDLTMINEMIVTSAMGV